LDGHSDHKAQIRSELIFENFVDVVKNAKEGVADDNRDHGLEQFLRGVVRGFGLKGFDGFFGIMSDQTSEVEMED
jgi:hypothetical protein